MSDCRPEKLLQHAFGDETADERIASLAHIESCRGCLEDLAALRAIVAYDRFQAQAGSAPLDLIERSRKAALRAADDAAAHLQILLSVPSRDRFRTLHEQRSIISPALGWLLMDAAEAHIFTEPREALHLYSLATYVVDAAAALAFHCPDLRMEAWKNYGWLLSFLGEYTRAEHALFFAEDAAEECADRTHMLAIVHLTRAILLSQMERWSEALPIVTEARETFSRLGDSVRELKAREQEANIRMKTGDGAGAVAILAQIVDLPADELTRARRFGNIAHALELAGAYWSASEYIARSSAIHTRAGAMLMVYRDAWALARILSKTGRVAEATAQFQIAANGFRSLDAVDSAIRAELDQSEIELEHRITTEATYTRLRAAATYAVEKRLPVAQCRALAYLQERGRTATVSHVRYVRDFFVRLQTNPHVDFHPPEAG